METRNITLNLPSSLVRKVKIRAAENDMTINAFVRNLLEQAVGETSAQVAAKRLLAAAETGKLSFNADLRSIRREDLYDRA